MTQRIAIFGFDRSTVMSRPWRRVDEVTEPQDRLAVALAAI